MNGLPRAKKYRRAALNNRTKVTNIVLAGLGGQGVLKASDLVAEVAFRAGFDVKKSEIHGMSQRGGSVTSDVRFGERVYSPMVPPGEADDLVVLSPDQVEPNRWQLREGGTLITPAAIPEGSLRDKRSLNVALLGWLSVSLPFPESAWEEAIRQSLAPKLHATNLQAFAIGRAAAQRGLRPQPRM
jgi:indolepyruvate ferredoxin oxidoreductase beta subunit